jgi:hypothetical protein
MRLLEREAFLERLGARPAADAVASRLQGIGGRTQDGEPAAPR